MQYPSEFPHDARARVEAETRRAYIALEQDVRGVEKWRRGLMRVQPYIYIVVPKYPAPAVNLFVVSGLVEQCRWTLPRGKLSATI